MLFRSEEGKTVCELRLYLGTNALGYSFYYPCVCYGCVFADVLFGCTVYVGVQRICVWRVEGLVVGPGLGAWGPRPAGGCRWELPVVLCSGGIYVPPLPAFPLRCCVVPAGERQPQHEVI